MRKCKEAVESMTERILFDTTYLLPILGMRVRGLREYEKCIGRILYIYDVYYHPVSLIESKWELLHLLRRIRIEEWKTVTSRYRQGLNYILKSGKLTQLRFTNIEIEEEVDYLIEKGYRDYFDLLIFSTAFIKGLTLVTEDSELRSIPSKLKRYEDIKIMNWDELIKSLPNE